MLRGELEPDRNAAADIADAVGHRREVVRRFQVVEPRGADGVGARFEVPNLRDLPLDLLAREVAAGAGLGTLARLEMERLYVRDLLDVPAELPGGVLVEVPRVDRLLFGEHPALAGADPRPGCVRALRDGDFRLLAQGAEAHVADEHRDLQFKRVLGVRADDEPRVDRRLAVVVGLDPRRELL